MVFSRRFGKTRAGDKDVESHVLNQHGSPVIMHYVP